MGLLLLVVGLSLFFVAVILPLLLWSEVKELQRVVGRLQSQVTRLEVERGGIVGAPAKQTPPIPSPEALTPSVEAMPHIAARKEEVPAPVHPAPAPARRSASGSDTNLEALIAGRWLNRVGLLLVFLAVAYFIQWSIDNQWIGPT